MSIISGSICGGIVPARLLDRRTGNRASDNFDHRLRPEVESIGSTQ